jgi:hypothetical protein
MAKSSASPTPQNAPIFNFFCDVNGLFEGKVLMNFKYRPVYFLRLKAEIYHPSNPHGGTESSFDMSVSEDVYRKAQKILAESKAEAPRLRLVPKDGKLELIAEE